MSYKLLALALLVAIAGCVDRSSTRSGVPTPSSPTDLSGASPNEWHEHVGKRIMVHGRFSLQGKIGPLIVVGGRTIYIKPKRPGSWVDGFSKFEDREVRVTGILRHWKSPDAPQGPVTEARIPDHFYFEDDTTDIQHELTK